MKRRMRASSASSRIPREPCCGALEADQTPDERVVPRVGRVAVPLTQEKIEPLLGLGERRGDRQAELTEPGGADRDEEGFDGLEALLEIADAPAEQVLARQRSGLRISSHESK